MPNTHSLLQCYLCADCGDPFNPEYPYTSVVTNQNYGASCIVCNIEFLIRYKSIDFLFKKSVLTVPNGKLVNRGTTFSCTAASTTDIKVYCCQTDLCNGSNSLKQLTSLLLFPYIIHLIFF